MSLIGSLGKKTELRVIFEIDTHKHWKYRNANNSSICSIEYEKLTRSNKVKWPRTPKKPNRIYTLKWKEFRNIGWPEADRSFEELKGTSRACEGQSHSEHLEKE